jgi:hypothetical protein
LPESHDQLFSLVNDRKRSINTSGRLSRIVTELEGRTMTNTQRITPGTLIATDRWGDRTRDQGRVKRLSDDGRWVYVHMAGTMVEEELSVDEVIVV